MKINVLRRQKSSLSTPGCHALFEWPQTYHLKSCWWIVFVRDWIKKQFSLFLSFSVFNNDFKRYYFNKKISLSNKKIKMSWADKYRNSCKRLRKKEKKRKYRLKDHKHHLLTSILIQCGNSIYYQIYLPGTSKKLNRFVTIIRKKSINIAFLNVSVFDVISLSFLR